LARLPQHTGAYTALFTFAVTVKNNLLISMRQFDVAKSGFPGVSTSHDAALTNNSHHTAGLAKAGTHSVRALTYQNVLMNFKVV
jgi:hypothetical protein